MEPNVPWHFHSHMHHHIAKIKYICDHFVFSSQCKATCFFAVESKFKQRTFVYCREVADFFVLFRIVLINDLQGFFELQHGCKFVFAVVAAKARAYKVADIAVCIFKLHLVSFASFHNRITPGIIDVLFYRGFILPYCIYIITTTPKMTIPINAAGFPLTCEYDPDNILFLLFSCLFGAKKNTA